MKLFKIVKSVVDAVKQTVQCGEEKSQLTSLIQGMVGPTNREIKSLANLKFILQGVLIHRNHHLLQSTPNIVLRKTVMDTFPGPFNKFGSNLVARLFIIVSTPIKVQV